MLEGRSALKSSALLPAMNPVMQCTAVLLPALLAYEVTQNSGMKQSVQTTSKNPSGQNASLNARITCKRVEDSVKSTYPGSVAASAGACKASEKMSLVMLAGKVVS